MDENHPKNKDPRPKRRRDKDNPYTIFSEGIHTEKPHFYLSFIDSSGTCQCMEIDQMLFDTLDKFELEDLSFMNEVDNHYEHAELTEQSLNMRASVPLESLEDTIFQRMQNEMLHKAIDMLPEIQRRRLRLYYFSGYTYEQIADRESCTKQAVKKSIDSAIERLKKFFEKFSP